MQSSAGLDFVLAAVERIKKYIVFEKLHQVFFLFFGNFVQFFFIELKKR
jgi:hypothetical protein